jgi:aldehyde dehydrogenase (NAD+)
MRLAELCMEAGLSPGVLNLVTGKGSEIGDAMTSHPDIEKVAFTGSTSVGKKIMEGCASSLKDVTLELGGNSPVIVAPDADLDIAVSGCHEALFFNTGEACECGARLFVHDSIYDEFVARSVELAKNRRAGDPFEEGVRQGPIVSEKQMEKVLDYIKKGKEEGQFGKMLASWFVQYCFDLFL